MTRSIFDPGNPNVERSGDTFTGPDANQISRMPGSVIDGDAGRKGNDPDGGPLDNVGFDAAGESVATRPPGADASADAGIEADDVDVDGAMDEVQDAHALNMKKRWEAEA